MSEFDDYEQRGDRQRIREEIGGSNSDNGRVDEPIFPVGNGDEKDGKTHSSGDEPRKTRYCEEIPSKSKQKLKRTVHFLSPANVEWLKFWADRHGKRSPSQFLNDLIDKLRKEFGDG